MEDLFYLSCSVKESKQDDTTSYNSDFCEYDSIVDEEEEVKETPPMFEYDIKQLIEMCDQALTERIISDEQNNENVIFEVVEEPIKVDETVEEVAIEQVMMRSSEHISPEKSESIKRKIGDILEEVKSICDELETVDISFAETFVSSSKKTPVL